MSRIQPTCLHRISNYAPVSKDDLIYVVPVPHSRDFTLSSSPDFSPMNEIVQDEAPQDSLVLWAIIWILILAIFFGMSSIANIIGF